MVRVRSVGGGVQCGGFEAKLARSLEDSYGNFAAAGGELSIPEQCGELTD